MADEPKIQMLKVEIVRRYWPRTATSDADAFDVGTLIDLPFGVAKPLVNSGVAKLA